MQSPQTPVADWLRVEEAAELLDVSARKVYRLINEGKLPAEKVANKWRIRRDDIAKVDAK